MIGLVSVATGVAVYLVALAAIGYYCGEAPGRLRVVIAHLKGDLAPGRPFLRWSSAGGLSRKQHCLLAALAIVVLGGTGLFLFRSWLVATILALGAPVYPLSVERSLNRKRQALLLNQFGMALQVMASSLRAGASLRTAVERCGPDLDRMLSGQPMKPMVEELEQMARDMRLGGSLEDALVRFRDRVGLEDVTDFVNAILLCRVRGGNAALVMASIAEIIQDKIAVNQQILTLTAGKRMEANLITFAPPALVAFLGFTSPGYMAPFYESTTGLALLLTGCGCLAAAYVIGRKVLDIEV